MMDALPYVALWASAGALGAACYSLWRAWRMICDQRRDIVGLCGKSFDHGFYACQERALEAIRSASDPSGAAEIIGWLSPAASERRKNEDD